MKKECFYPDWEGGWDVGEHNFEFGDGFCSICGEYDPTKDKRNESNIQTKLN